MLPEDAVSGTAAVTFAGFPGIWTPGQPIAVAELARHGALSQDEVGEKVEELGLPLEPAEVGADEGAMPMPPNHRASRDEAAHEALEEQRPRARSHKELDERASEVGLEWPRADMTREQKQQLLDEHVAAQELQPDEPEEPQEDEG